MALHNAESHRPQNKGFIDCLYYHCHLQLSYQTNKTSDILFSTQWAFMKKMNAILYWTTTYASLILDSVYIEQILLVLYCLSGLFMFCCVRSNGYIYLS
jgi:hypothetical protein